MVRHPVSHLVQACHEIPRWFVVAPYNRAAERQRLVERQPRGPKLVRRPADVSQNVTKALLYQKVGSEDQKRRVLGLFKMPTDLFERVHSCPLWVVRAETLTVVPT